MNANLLKALQYRGFIVRKGEGGIYFSRGNHASELDKLTKVFEELQISFAIEDRLIVPQSEKLTEEQAYKLSWYPARNHEAGGTPLGQYWRSFAKRDHSYKIDTFVLETGVAALCKALSAVGINGISSCDGHGQRAPFIALTGVHNGSWFNVLFEEYIAKEAMLHYTWGMREFHRRDPHFTAEKSEHQSWDLSLVLEDTFKMAELLYARQDELIAVRKKIMKGKAVARMRKGMNHVELQEWMRQRYKEETASTLTV
ncbi:hypothetical protein ACFFJY_14160 [Fictibacillus aquaticus]|uniref:Uncharacterized protein n=1 Tax=Fictibacillus aquaticus TaxID=2021314 RepID=A0A235FD84_9BACL|nr:hypothetical protein [Fictibacillus aquaticus]OYD59360.1 hypothetical protein CGZ90_05580 [Fictibacillus aquaticus]